MSGSDVRGGTAPGRVLSRLPSSRTMAYKKGYVAYKCHHLGGELSTPINRTSSGLGGRLSWRRRSLDGCGLDLKAELRGADRHPPLSVRSLASWRAFWSWPDWIISSWTRGWQGSCIFACFASKIPRRRYMRSGVQRDIGYASLEAEGENNSHLSRHESGAKYPVPTTGRGPSLICLAHFGAHFPSCVGVSFWVIKKWRCSLLWRPSRGRLCLYQQPQKVRR